MKYAILMINGKYLDKYSLQFVYYIYNILGKFLIIDFCGHFKNTDLLHVNIIVTNMH